MVKPSLSSDRAVRCVPSASSIIGGLRRESVTIQSLVEFVAHVDFSLTLARAGLGAIIEGGETVMCNLTQVVSYSAVCAVMFGDVVVCAWASWSGVGALSPPVMRRRLPPSLVEHGTWFRALVSGPSTLGRSITVVVEPVRRNVVTWRAVVGWCHCPSHVCVWPRSGLGNSVCFIMAANFCNFTSSHTWSSQGSLSVVLPRA